MSNSLTGQVALVTGGSRGIGKGIAGRLAAEGAEVVITSRDAATARDVAAEISGAVGPASTVRGIGLDIADEASVEAGVGELLQSYDKIPILVNNAGITRDGLLLRMKPVDWSLVVDTNLTGIYRLCRALLPKMVRARYGRIVNVTSVVAASGNAGQSNYAAAKSGVEGFTRSLAREVASRNVTVNCIAPGFIDTDMTRDLGEAARKKLLEQVPMNRLGQPDDVAGAVLFLAGPDASYVTGTTLHVNGGMYM